MEFLLFFDGAEGTVQSIDEVMSTPHFGGETLADIAQKITITEF